MRACTSTMPYYVIYTHLFLKWYMVNKNYKHANNKKNLQIMCYNCHILIIHWYVINQSNTLNESRLAALKVTHNV